MWHQLGRRHWHPLLWLVLAAVLAAAVVAPPALAGRDDQPLADAGATDGSASVVVAVDAPTYAPGDPITASVTNGGVLAVAPRGGLVCQGSPWPFALQQQDAAGSWQDVPAPRTPPCIAIAVALLPPGATRTTTLTAGDAGTYRLVYVFTATDGTQGSAASDPFVVDPAASAAPG